MEIGTIKSVHIYCHDNYYVTAALTLNVKGVNFCFGGDPVFLSGMHGGQAGDFPYLGKFIFRCLQICDLDDWELLKSQKVLVNIVDNIAMAIGNLSGRDFFNPALEFKYNKRTETIQSAVIKQDQKNR